MLILFNCTRDWLIINRFSSFKINQFLDHVHNLNVKCNWIKIQSDQKFNRFQGTKHRYINSVCVCACIHIDIKGRRRNKQ